jgi:hypothetical protein
VVEVHQREGAGLGLEAQHQLAAGQHLAVVAAEHRQQHLAGELHVQRLPVDVEVLRVERGRAVLQHVHPPGVVGAEHAHVVGHHVQQLAHAVRAQRRDEAREAFLAAQLGVDLVVRHHVVAVHAARARALDGRAVHVAHAQLGQVGQHANRVVEAEVLVELQAVGGARHARLHAPAAARALRARTRRRGRTARRCAEKPCMRSLSASARTRPAACAASWAARSPVPGMLACSTTPAASSSCTIINADGRGGQVGMHRLHDARGRQRLARGLGHLLAAQQPAALGRQHELDALLRAVEQLLVEHALVGEQAQRQAHAQVVAGPPAGEGGQVVRAHGHQRGGG